MSDEEGVGESDGEDEGGSEQKSEKTKCGEDIRRGRKKWMTWLV